MLAQEIERRVDQLTAINIVASTVSQSLDLNVTLETALEAVTSVLHVDAAGISLVDHASGELVLRAQRGWKYDFVSAPVRIPLGEGLSGIAIARDEVVITGDLTNDPRLAVPEFAAERVQAMALVPMHARGRVVGILNVMEYSPCEFSDAEISVLRAIADQVGVAIENAQLYEQTEEQSSRLNAVLQSSGDAIIATDSRGMINLINTTAESLFSMRPADILRRPLRDAPLHPSLREGLRRAMANNCSTVFEVTLDDGRFLSSIVSPVYASPSALNCDHRAEGWVMVVRDITHLREAEQSRVNFIHAAAHDLRNPLGATLSALLMLESDLGDVSDIHREIISIGIDSVNRMQDLIDDLLNLEHISSGIGIKWQDVDIRDLIERGVADIRPSIYSRNQMLRIDVPGALPPIHGDIHWLYRALFNLLTNANKYTPPQGEIVVRAYERDGALYLEVEDNGPGIPPEAQPHLFERFYRVPATAHEAKGTGLGLSIVKTVVEQHRGRAFAQSKPGQGSIFGMIFPLSCDES